MMYRFKPTIEIFNLRKLRALDRLNIIGIVAIAVTALFFHAKVRHYLLISIVNCLVAVGLIFCTNVYAALRQRRDILGENSWKNKANIVEFILQWYTLPLIFLTFKEMYLMVHAINPQDLDYLLIKADRFIFGVDPTSLLDKIATRGLTEFLQICYSSFYLLWIILGIDLLKNKNQEGFLFFLFTLMYGFYTSFVGYIFVPAIGPRFTLYNFANLDHDLPGLYLTSFLRHIINSGESITNIANAAMLAQRDCFPSGHTEMTIITIAIAIKYRAKSSMLLLPLGLGLIFATVYMRYHYGVDVIAGVLFAIFVLSSAKWLETRLKCGIESHAALDVATERTGLNGIEIKVEDQEMK
jgi:membrane-associated phospholipid phosphatase